MIKWLYCFTDGLSMLTSKEVYAIMKTQVPKLLHARIDELEELLESSTKLLEVASCGESDDSECAIQVFYNNESLIKGISV